MLTDQPDPPDAELPRLRRRRLLLRQRKIPVRFLVPNFFTLLSLCAGVTAIRMAIEERYDFAVALVVAAALLDGVDGRLARALKSQSRFGAELDSLADVINFGVAPAVIMFTWGLTGLKGFGWLSVLVFACGMSLRLARFNSMLEVDKPKWQSNYFTGMPAPAGAITVFLPLYLSHIGVFDARQWPAAIALYTLAMAGLLVSTIPTFSGKLVGERISREWVLPILVGAALLVGLLFTYTYPTLAVVTIIYLALIPMSFRRFQQHKTAWEAEHGRDVTQPAPGTTPPTQPHGQPPIDLQTIPPGETKH